jgi:alanine racemase
MTMSKQPLPHTWLELRAAALQHNIQHLQKHVQQNQSQLGVVVKANAYGHGIQEIVSLLLTLNVQQFIVTNVHEGMLLRQMAPHSQIHLCGPSFPHEAFDIVRHHIQPIVYNNAQIEALFHATQELHTTIPVVLKIETGTHRLGVTAQEALTLAHSIRSKSSLHLVGMSTHFADIEDTLDTHYAHLQMDRLLSAKNLLEQQGFHSLTIHAANSAATILHPWTHGSLVRCGIATYGLWPTSHASSSLTWALHPVLEWKTRIAHIQNVDKGEDIGYGRTYHTSEQIRLAVLPVGYHEGYNRLLSNRSSVLIHGQYAPVRGRICMNMMMVDVTHIPHACVNDVVTLLGFDGDQQISADTLADGCGTIHYEFVSRLLPTLTRFVV